MVCLRCHEKMKKNALAGVLVDFCTNCNSFWLDAGELDNLRAKEKKSEAELAQEAKAERRAERSQLITYTELCPRCQESSLIPVHEGPVELDKCKRCGGLFFDFGELQKCLEMPETSWLRRLFNAIKK